MQDVDKLSDIEMLINDELDAVLAESSSEPDYEGEDETVQTESFISTY